MIKFYLKIELYKVLLTAYAKLVNKCTDPRK